MCAKRRRRQQHPSGRIRTVLNSFGGAKDADQALDPIVVGREILVADRPIDTETISAEGAEIVRAITQRIESPMVGAPAQHASAPPAKLRSRSDRVWLPRNLPSTVYSGVVISKRLIRCRCAIQRGVRLDLKHRSFLRGVVVAARLEQQHIEPALGEHIGRHSPSGSGADDDGVVFVLCRFHFNAGYMVQPPSITWTAPVVNADSSDAR